MSEYILCAAIHYDNGNKYEHQPKNIESGFLICGRRHHNIISILAIKFKYRSISSESKKVVQGFITNSDRFVNRSLAMEIAVKSGQYPNLEKKSELFSEDLY